MGLKTTCFIIIWFPKVATSYLPHPYGRGRGMGPACSERGVSTDTTCNVVNLSQHELSPDELELLSMGISFIPSPGRNKFSNNTLVGDFKTLEEGYIANYRRSVPMGSAKLLDKVCGRIQGDLDLVGL